MSKKYFKYDFKLTPEDIDALLSNDKEVIAKVFESSKFLNEGCEYGRSIGLKEGIKLGKKIGYRKALILMLIVGGGSWLGWKNRKKIKEWLFGKDNTDVDTEKWKVNDEEYENDDDDETIIVE